MEVEDVLRADLAPELADRLEERLRLDVADGAADLRDDDVRRVPDGDAPDPLLDLVRDVRDDLDGRAEVLALALAQHRYQMPPAVWFAALRERFSSMKRSSWPMSRSVSAPSSVTNTSPCWNGLIVPGSTLRYGSNFCTCTLRPRSFSSRPSDAATMPLAERRDDSAGDEDVLHGLRPSASSSRSTGVGSITRPSERRSPRAVRAASEAIAIQRPFPVETIHGRQA